MHPTRCQPSTVSTCQLGLIIMLIGHLIIPPTLVIPRQAHAAFIPAPADRLPQVPDISYDFATGDIDADGDTDVLIANAGQSRLLLGDGPDGFSDVTTTHLPDLTLTSMAAALGDVDGDLDLDLILADVHGPNRLLLNDGAGRFTLAPEGDLPAQRQVSVALALGDVDHDGDLDLVVANRRSQNRLWLNQGDGRFRDATETHLPADAIDSYDIALGDVDGNGTLDLVVANHGAPNQLLLNNGLGIFTDVTENQFPGALSESFDVELSDLDADGDVDVVIAAGVIPLRLWLNGGNGGFTEVTSTHLPAFSAFGFRVKSGDVDADVDVDLVLAAAGQDRVFLGDGSGHFIDATDTFIPDDIQRSFGLALLDADRDLDADLLVASPGGANRFFLNDLPVPRVQVSVTPKAPHEVGAPITLRIEAADEDGLASATLTLADPAGQTQPIILLPDLEDGLALHTFTPALAGDYRATVQVADPLGHLQTRQLPLAVLDRDITAPQVAVGVGTPAPIRVGQPVSLHVTSTDDRGVTHTTLTINDRSVPLTSGGTATFITTLPGPHAVVARAHDGAGNVGQATISFTVEADTTPPTLTLSVSPQTVELTEPVAISVTATDNVAVTSRTLRVQGPAIPEGIHLTLDPSGQGTFTPFQPGTYTLEATASDPSNNVGIASASFTATGTPDTTPPTVAVQAAPNPVGIGMPITLTVSVTDASPIASIILTIDDITVPLDAAGQATYTPPSVGTYTAMAVARDIFGNSGAAQTTFEVVDPDADTAAPVIGIRSPEPDSELTAPTEIIGTVQDETLVRYTLAYAPRGANTFTPFAKGDINITEGVLGTLDTSMLINGLYDIRLTAEDSRGRIASLTTVYQVTGHLKVGHFSFTVEDLNIPVAGLPITITRTYDSRDKGQGDFGIGWRLGIQSMTVWENRMLGTSWQQVKGSAGFVNFYCVEPVGEHYVSVTLPDGRVDTFDFLPQTPEDSRSGDLGDLPLNCQFVLPVQFATSSFTPRPGTHSRLEPISAHDLTIVGGEGPVDILSQGDISHYDPSQYRLTTAEGMIFELDQDFGVRSMTDVNGNTLAFGSNGITHSTGKSVTFTRDTNGRISQITDPMGDTIQYEYDPNGDLVALVDQENFTTRYHYDDAHLLTEIEDPRGIVPARTIYDDAGRLIATEDADGNRVNFTHDVEGRREIIQDRLGNTTVLIYDDKGNVLSQTNALGQTTTFTYDDRGNVLTITDPLGHTKTFTYDDRNNVLTRTDPLGHTTTFTYNERRQVLSRTNGNGHTTTFDYDANGNLTSVIDGLGFTTRHTYGTQGNLLSTTDALNRTTTFDYDTSGNLIRHTDPLGHETTFSYDASGNLLTMTQLRTDNQGTVETLATTRVYDARNRLIEEIDPEGNRSFTEYDAFGNITALVDKNGHRTEFVYDARGQHSETIHPDGARETLIYNAQGHHTGFIDRAGRMTQYEYDALGRLIRTVFPDGSVTTATFDPAGRPQTHTDQRGHATTYSYDAGGRRTSVTNALGQTTYFAYDALGNISEVTDANGQTTSYSYDAALRRTATQFPDGTLATIRYDPVGQKIAETDQAGNTTQFAYDAVGQLIRITDALGQDTLFSYDETGNRLTQTDANHHTTQWTYDKVGNILTRTLPLGMTEFFAYDANGNVLTHTDFNGQTTSFTYDQDNRIGTRTFPDTTQVLYTYLPSGERDTITDDRGVTTYRYNISGQLGEIEHPDGTTLIYTYDAAANRTSMTLPSGTTLYTYDALNRLETVTAPGGASTVYTYDLVGNLNRVMYPNDTHTDYTYDPLNRLTTLEHMTSMGDTIARYSYTLGAAGNRLRVEEHTGRIVDYTYDSLYRLTREMITDPVNGDHTSAYTYDPVGNRLTKTDQTAALSYHYDANDRLLTAGSATYTYDPNGNTLTMTTGGHITTYTYDAQNRLIAVQTPNTMETYEYDPDGLRVRRSRNGDVTNFLVDANREFAQVVEERDDTYALGASYVYGHDLISQVREQTTSYYHPDGLGSTRVLTDSAGQPTDTYTYDAFGSELAMTGTTDNPYRYSGEQYEPLLDGYYLRARYYQPGIGRFLSSDPFPGRSTSPLSLHKYLYAQANPVNRIDPSGLVSLHSQTAAQIGFVALILGFAVLNTRKSLHQAEVARIQASEPALRECALQEVFSKESIEVDSSHPCRIRDLPIFFTGSDVQEATDHDKIAIMDQKPVLLEFAARYKPDHWYNAADIEECSDEERANHPKGHACDEYPFAATKQGGRGHYDQGNVSLMLINPIHNSKQGSIFRWRFVRDCDLKQAANRNSTIFDLESAFGVATTRASTFHLCNDDL